jgi:hypothetical protein
MELAEGVKLWLFLLVGLLAGRLCGLLWLELRDYLRSRGR